MTFTKIIKNIFTKKSNIAKDNSFKSKNKLRAFFSRLPSGFMLPITIMALAGLFLGIGSVLEVSSNAKFFGIFLKSISNPIFGVMPTLFLIAIIIAFTNEAGVGVFAGIVAFVVFNSMQTPFIDAQGDGITGKATFLGIQTSPDIQKKMYNVVGNNLGITSINSSIFGGVIVGLIVAWLYNHFHIIELPKILAIFGGKRFVAIISVLIMIPITFLFLLIWPWVAVGLAYFGEYSGKVAGLDSFVFGYINRATLPLGLAWSISAPFGMTPVGGDILEAFGRWEGTIIYINGQDILGDFNNESLAILKEELLSLRGIWSAQDVQAIIDADGKHIAKVISTIANNFSREILFDNFAVISKGINYQEANSLNSVFINKIIANGTYMGDGFGWLAAYGSGIDNVTYQIDGHTYTEKVFPFIDNQLDLNLGRFGLSGCIAIQQFGLPAAALAMVMLAPKDRRKEAMSIYLPAAFTCFLVGVTEPLEYTFVFLAPMLFFGFHSLMTAFSYLFMNLSHVHFTTTFGGGLINAVIYGMIPFAKGTNFYWAYVLGLIYAPIYYFVFYWWIKHFNILIPGRGKKSQLLTKHDLKSRNNQKLTIREASLIKAIGGWSNISSFNTCITRLRYDIKNKKLVNEQALKNVGVHGVVWNGKNLQIIIGAEAEQMNNNIKKHINIDLDEILNQKLTNEQKKKNK